MIPLPPKLEDLRAGTQLVAGLGKSTILADLDFETYSPAGFVWNEKTQKHVGLHGAEKKTKGLSVVNVARYVEHPDAEVLSLAYDLKDGQGKRLWVPGNGYPLYLFEHVQRGLLLEAWNCPFERWVWTKICVPKYGFPPLGMNQLRDAAAKARAFGLPGSLDPCGTVLDIVAKKDKDGKRLLNKFSIPRDPTLKDSRRRIRPTDPDATEDAQKLYAYNLRDIEAEAEISSQIPDLTANELDFWLCDQQINHRGVKVDKESIENCIKILEKAYLKYNAELPAITGNPEMSATKVAQMKKWLETQSIFEDSLNKNIVAELLERDDLTPSARKVLEVRALISSAAVKKVYAMNNQMTTQGKLHDLFIYHSARTGRATGSGPQPQNLPSGGPAVAKCGSPHCAAYFPYEFRTCPWCGEVNTSKIHEWGPKAVEYALKTINTGNLDCVEYFWGSAVSTVSGCLRGLFIASEGHDLVCSDYSAIEAVVLAALCGEEWRLEVFRTHGKIYEMSASKITGIPFEEFELYKATTEQHHPMRKKVGKVAELASGYQGWIGAWKQFGADEFFTEDEIRRAILAWRGANPAIVEMWGGQEKKWQPCFYGLEGAAISAVLNPGQEFSHREISYLVRGDILYCGLPSKRYICYHRPRLAPSDRRAGTLSLSFEGWNTNTNNGPVGWIRMNTYGGKLTENVVQAVARDILAHAIVNLEKSGYPVVLHIHDEIVCEVPEGQGSIEELEKIMSTMPSWAADWPVKAKGGWRAKRYTK